MKDLDKPVFIHVYSLNSNNQYFINNIEDKYKEVYISDAIEASMAAPTLFPMKILYYDQQET